MVTTRAKLDDMAFAPKLADLEVECDHERAIHDLLYDGHEVVLVTRLVDAMPA